MSRDSDSIDAAEEPVLSEKALRACLDRLDDEELSALEYDLEVCRVAEAPSLRVLEILDSLMDLDRGWANQLKNAAANGYVKRNAV